MYKPDQNYNDENDNTTASIPLLHVPAVNTKFIQSYHLPQFLPRPTKPPMYMYPKAFDLYYRAFNAPSW